MSGTEEGRQKQAGTIRGALGQGTIRGGKTTIFVAGNELAMLRLIAERSGLTAAGAVRAMIHLHRNDTIHVEQKIEMQTKVRAEKP